MPAHQLPQWAADDVEWMLLGLGRDEVSRGDIQMETSFYVPVEDEATEVDQVASKTALDKSIDDCFDHLEYRAKAFRGNYALRVDADVLSKGAGVETDPQLVYRFLLASSRSDLSQALGTTFSELCKLALHRFFGGRASVWNVDAGSKERRSMGGSTRAVAKFLEPHLGAVADPAMLCQLPSRGGDGGVDLVACISFADNAAGSLAVFGQCAASASPDYWRDKIYQPARFKFLYRWNSPPTLALFIPFVYRSSTGAWLNEINIGESLVFDRLRILSCLKLESDPLPAALRKQLSQAISAAVKKAAAKKARRVQKAASKRRKPRAVKGATRGSSSGTKKV